MANARATSGPRERVASAGMPALSDAELVALILGTGRPGEPVDVLSVALLHEHGGIWGLARAGPGALSLRAGLGRAKGARVAAALELGRRAAQRPPPRWRFPDSRAVDAWARPHLVALDHEELWVLALDGAHGLRGAHRVAMGGLHGVHVSPCDPLRAALREGASAFVLVHNHPSGDPTPSRQDIEFTARMEQAAQIVATPLVDHVIVARDGYQSLLDSSLLPPARFGAGHGE